jgi:hypothetical protein
VRELFVPHVLQAGETGISLCLVEQLDHVSEVLSSLLIRFFAQMIAEKIDCGAKVKIVRS